MKSAKGFTLIEIMLVVALIGIIAAIAIPAYGDYVKRGKVVDATTQLSDARVKIEQYYQDNRTYVGWTCPSATKYFTFNCNIPSSTTYVITATGLADLASFQYTIDQDNNKTSATPWGNGATCWIVSKGSTC